ncbi:MAG: hypothetical protein E7027_05520 [Elusimicrobium sp.]|jgi:hypothetical protein|uniref:Uncharacterized protein n=1 Tax=Candidatus Avelusimicrobium gallicola TaxID=2562704 RepID=A0A928DPG0_9BACT|nr:hypothetical protein [Elusimicrobium sp.]
MITKVQSWVYVLSVLGAVVFWAVTMYGLPPRVTRLEEQMKEYERGRIATEVRQAMILDAVTRIENFILNRHGKE